MVQASVDQYSIINGPEERLNSKGHNGSRHNRTSSLTVQDIEGIGQSRLNIGTGSVGSGHENQNLNTSTNNFGVRTGEKHH